MANDIVLDIKVTVPLYVEPAGDMPDKWAEGLVNNALRMKDRMLEVLPNDGEYQSRVAEISNQKWKGMIAPGFVSKRGKNQANIIRAQYKGLADAYNKFLEKYGLAFATVDGVEAKRFKDQVNNSKDIWANGVAKSTLRITGDRIRGLIIPQTVYWMTGDPLANRMNRHLELIAGNPYDFTKAGLRQQFRSAATNLLITAGMTILKADMETAEVAAQNGRLVDLANAFRDTVGTPVKPFVVGGGATDSLLEYEFSDPEFKLHARIVLV
ncbi:MAG: hypothetical protein HY762_04195 [Planctomycetes bacterium]|nr:hypothetical protein [Planctomycetota bacterium]